MPESVEHKGYSEPKGPIWQLTIGGKSQEELQEELQRGGYQVDPYAKDMMISRNFTTLEEQEEVNLIKLKLSDLGFSEYPTTDQIYERALELGLELCSAEVGPHLRLTYKQQPKKEGFFIAMKQIADRYGYEGIFKLWHSEDGLRLDFFWARPARKWNPIHGFVFSLRSNTPI